MLYNALFFYHIIKGAAQASGIIELVDGSHDMPICDANGLHHLVDMIYILWISMSSIQPL